MNIKNAVALSSFFALLFSSCTTFRFEPLPKEDITIKVNRGKNYPVFSNEKIEAIVKPEFRNNEVMVKVSIYNKAENTFLISDTDFSIFSSNDRKNWENVTLYSSEEYYSKEKSKYIAGAVLLAVAAIGSEIDYAYTHTTTTNVYTYRYGVYHRYQVKTVHIDPVGREMALYHNFEIISDYAHSGKHWLNLLENNLFYSTDIDPDTEYFGLLFSKQSDQSFYRVKINNPNIKCSFDFEIVEE